MNRIKFRVIATGAAVKREQIDAAIGVLTGLGHSVSLGEHVFAQYRYLAGTIAQRAADLQAALADPEVDAIWIARGGFGSAQLMSTLDALPVSKPIIGYSDNCVILHEFARRNGVAIHGPCFERIGASDTSQRRPEDIQEVLSLINHLRCGQRSALVRPFGGHQVAGPRVDELHGKVTGGNLATIVSVIGSPWELDCNDKILLLEDVGEAYYRIERMLLQLQAAGKLQNLIAVGLGEFLNCPRRDVEHGIEQIFAEYLTPLGIPLFTGLPFGHGLVNRPWLMHETGVLSQAGLTLQPPLAECDDE